MPSLPCPACGQVLLATRAHAGRRMRCPSCAETLTVPEPSADAVADPDDDDARAAAAAIARAVGDRPRGVPGPLAPARAAVRKPLLVLAAIVGALVLLAGVLASVWLD